MFSLNVFASFVQRRLLPMGDICDRDQRVQVTCFRVVDEPEDLMLRNEVKLKLKVFRLDSSDALGLVALSRSQIQTRSRFDLRLWRAASV